MGKMSFISNVVREFKRKYGYNKIDAYTMALHSPLVLIYNDDPVLVSCTPYEMWADYLHDWCLQEGLIENK